MFGHPVFDQGDICPYCAVTTHWVTRRNVFVAASLCAVSLILWLGRYTTFHHDECDFLHHRPDIASLLVPHNEHPVLIPGLAYKGVIEAFGTGSYLPFLGLVEVAHVATAAGILALIPGRVGLAAAVLLLFLGGGADNLFWAFQVGFVASAAFGVWSIWAAVQGRTLLSALLGTASVFSHLTGVPFALAGAIIGRSRWSLLPAGALLVWWLAFGLGWERPPDWALSEYSSPVELEAWLILPSFIVRATGQTLVAVGGLGFLPGLAMLALSVSAGATTIALGLFLGIRGWRPPAFVVAMAAGLLTTVVMVGLVRAVGTGFSPRHIYIAAVFVLLAMASLPRLSPFVGATLFSIAFAGNLVTLAQSAAEWTARAAGPLVCDP